MHHSQRYHEHATPHPRHTTRHSQAADSSQQPHALFNALGMVYAMVSISIVGFSSDPGLLAGYGRLVGVDDGWSDQWLLGTSQKGQKRAILGQYGPNWVP